MQQFDSLTALKAKAADPNTPPEDLSELLDLPIVGAIAAGNPNLPEDRLLHALNQHPDEALANPALQLMLVMHPEIMDRIQEDMSTLLAVLSSRNCPENLIEFALANPSKAAMQALLTNPALTPEHLQAIERAIKRSAVSGIRRKDIRLHANHPQAAGEDPQAVLLRELALASTRVPVQSLRDVPEEYHRALLNGNGEDYARYIDRLPDQTLLAEHPNPEVRAQAANHMSASMRLLECLARDADPSVRAAVAGNSRLPSELVDELARDPKRTVRIAAAGNHNLSPQAAASLLAEDDADIHEALAGHDSCPADVLRQVWRRFADRGQYREAWPVLRNRNCPPDVLTEVLETPASARAATSIGRGPFGRWSLDVSVRELHYRHVPCHPNLPQEWVPRLLQGDEHVRTSLARNRNLPEEALLQLAQDANYRVREAVASNKSTPAYIREGLRSDPDKRVREAAGAEKEESQTNTPYRLKSLPTTEHLAQALSRATTSETLDWLATHVSVPLVRLAVALNPSTTVSTLETLAGDAHKVVQDAARRRLQPGE